MLRAWQSQKRRRVFEIVREKRLISCSHHSRDTPHTASDQLTWLGIPPRPVTPAMIAVFILCIEKLPFHKNLLDDLQCL
jgi:hypothetical protein